MNISEWRQKIIEKMSVLLKVKKSQISIKGKSNQGLGIFGEKKAIACFCVCLLREKTKL